MGMMDWYDHEALSARVEHIEAMMKDRGWHEPECPVRRTQIAQQRLGAYLYPPNCACWLAEED